MLLLLLPLCSPISTLFSLFSTFRFLLFFLGFVFPFPSPTRDRSISCWVLLLFSMAAEPPSKRLKTIGSRGFIKESEFIRIITEALYSLGYDQSGNFLQDESGIPLHSTIVKQFLEQVKKGEWDNSIATLQRIQLQNEKAVIFLLLEQKFFEFLKSEKDTDALQILRQEMVPLGVNNKRVHELASKLLSASGKDTQGANSGSKVVEKLQHLFPPALIIPKKRLEYLIEKTFDYQLLYCDCHNIPNNEFSLCSDHHCGIHKIPSETVQTLEEHKDEVWYLEFSHNGKYLASSSKDKSAIIWEIDAQGKFTKKHKLVGHEKPVVMVLWSPDDKQVLTCGENEVIKRWTVDSGQCVQSYERNGVGSVSCGWFHDGKGIIGGMADRRICLWNLDGTELEHEQERREQKLSDVAMTTDGKWLVSVGTVCVISLFNRETRDVRLIREEDMITSFSVSKNNRHLLINLITQKIHVWNIEGQQPFKMFEYNGQKRSRFIIRSCFGGYEDSFIASGSEDSQVYIWSIVRARREPCSVLQGHSGAVNCVSWNPTDLHMLASASDDRTIKIWGLDKKLK
ncbi:putative WD repeat-containing protein 26 [Cardamine amara subsp. amara]|uniref:WD repeat-containing protein 26 n=1 Tax=Cardamine amara subsp. amara TaxID=228776 RepID=A0ABD1AB32_CARAN